MANGFARTDPLIGALAGLGGGAITGFQAGESARAGAENTLISILARERESERSRQNALALARARGGRAAKPPTPTTFTIQAVRDEAQSIRDTADSVLKDSVLRNQLVNQLKKNEPGINESEILRRTNENKRRASRLQTGMSVYLDTLSQIPADDRLAVQSAFSDLYSRIPGEIVGSPEEVKAALAKVNSLASAARRQYETRIQTGEGKAALRQGVQYALDLANVRAGLLEPGAEGPGPIAGPGASAYYEAAGALAETKKGQDPATAVAPLIADLRAKQDRTIASIEARLASDPASVQPSYTFPDTLVEPAVTSFFSKLGLQRNEVRTETGKILKQLQAEFAPRYEALNKKIEQVTREQKIQRGGLGVPTAIPGIGGPGPLSEPTAIPEFNVPIEPMVGPLGALPEEPEALAGPGPLGEGALELAGLQPPGAIPGLRPEAPLAATESLELLPPSGGGPDTVAGVGQQPMATVAENIPSAPRPIVATTPEAEGVARALIGTGPYTQDDFTAVAQWLEAAFDPEDLEELGNELGSLENLV